MRLAAANIRKRRRIESHKIGWRVVGRSWVAVGEDMACGTRWTRVIPCGRSIRNMRMCRQLGNRERVRLLAAALAQCVPAANMDRRAAPQVGQREVDASISAERGAEQREQRLV